MSATTRRRCHSSRRPRSPLVCRPAAAPRAARRSSSTRARCEWWQCVTFGRGGHTPRVRRSVAAKAAPLPRTVSEHAGQELALAVRQGLPQSCMHMQSANYCGGRALRHSAYLHDCGNEGVRRSTVGCGWHLRTHQVNTTRQSDNVGHGALHVLRWRVPEHVTRTHARTPPHTDTQTPTHPCDATQHRLVWPCSCTRCHTHLVSLVLHDGLQHQAEAVGLFNGQPH